MADKIDFEKSDEWQDFGRAYIKHDSNMAAAAREVGIKPHIVHHHSSRSQNFRDWLLKLASKAEDAANAAGRVRLANAVLSGKGLEPKLLKTQEQLFKRTDKTKPAEININVQTSEDVFSREQREELVKWMVEQRAREMVAAQRN